MIEYQFFYEWEKIWVFFLSTKLIFVDNEELFFF